MRTEAITKRENFLKTIEFGKPEWIPIRFEMFPAVWKKHGKKLEDLIRRHRLIFSHFEEGDRLIFNNSDPLFSYHSYYEDDWGCVWYNVKEGNLGQVVEHPLADYRDINKLRIPDPIEQFFGDPDNCLIGLHIPLF